ncbi:putative toxin-antitoxin system toxin component, PIN family [Candidatus Microgenomates bacterium]|nr:putative toxin-antitoxin system toxin component, PIN family [Candidatus Microgenomates bacterium]
MPSVILKVFLDSNIWFSAFYGSVNCQKLIKAHTNEKIKAVVSRQVLEESIRNIKEKIPEILSVFQTYLINYPPLLISDPEILNSRIRGLVNKYDQPIFISAMMGKVDYFVTGNIRHFQVKKLEKLTGIKILTPKQAVDLLRL